MSKDVSIWRDSMVFIDLRKAGVDARFAICDPADGTFFDCDELQIFASWEEFEEAFRDAYGEDCDLTSLRELAPSWVFDDTPPPRR